VISGRCTIFLSLHGRIGPETHKSDPHHAGIKKLPWAFFGNNPRSFRRVPRTSPELIYHEKCGECVTDAMSKDDREYRAFSSFSDFRPGTET
jgi:hypothetical protein